MRFWGYPFICLFSLTCCSQGYALTISEKKTALQQDSEESEYAPFLSSLNADLRESNRQLKRLYEEALSLQASGCSDTAQWEDLQYRLQHVKAHLKQIEELWVAEITERGGNPNDYALWSQAETTIYNLVADYGSDHVIYLIPSQIGNIKLSSYSKFMIPKEGFEECLTTLLARLGIGIREVSPWIRELYNTRQDGAGVLGVFSVKKDLEVLPPTAYIGFILSSKNIDVRADAQALKKFANSETIQIDVIGGKLWLFGTVGELSELLKIYDFIQADSVNQEYRIVPLTKIDPTEMLAILKAAFREDFLKEQDVSASGLKVVPLQNQGKSLFLSGTATLVYKAIDLIKNLEEGIENPSDKMVFWYNVKHSDPQELAALLSQVHDIFSQPTTAAGSANGTSATPVSSAIHIDTSADITPKEGSVKYGSFIADSKTGTLIMVIEREALPQIKLLLKKLDIPKKMVRIEVLLFERKLSNQHRSGLNLLRLGEEVCKKGSASLSWASSGILEFLFKGAGGALVPSYDFAYQFLMSQEDVRINASPSVVTMNQTPARIAIVEEMSIAVASEKDRLQYNRAQYGIMIKILPVINIGEEDGKSYITLETDITFDSTGKNTQERPDVTRRNITNKVRIADGETVIIGGLRCKHSSDSQDGIPFLGEIPGIGKLFGMDATTNTQTEMFVFITPKILDNPVEQEERQEEAFLSARPGEGKEFQEAIAAGENAIKTAREQASSRLVSSEELSVRDIEEQEYDGR